MDFLVTKSGQFCGLLALSRHKVRHRNGEEFKRCECNIVFFPLCRRATGWRVIDSFVV